MSNSLLPHNATAFEKNLAAVTARASDVDLSTVSTLWNADTCPLELLPWLAWAEQVPVWSSNWSEETQRSAITAARAIRRTRGTAGAVKTALRSLNLGVQTEEWFEQSPAGTPGTFKLFVDLTERGLDQAEQESIERAVNYSKNVRSHWSMSISITEHGHQYYGTATQEADETTLYPLIITEIVASMPLPLATATCDGETTTIYPQTAA